MATTDTMNNNSGSELVIQKLLRTGGFLFPQTVDEVIEFEKRFGSTDYPLPEELITPSFLKTRPRKLATSLQTTSQLALAARGGINKISDEVQKRMDSDRKAAKKKK